MSRTSATVFIRALLPALLLTIFISSDAWGDTPTPTPTPTPAPTPAPTLTEIEAEQYEEADSPDASGAQAANSDSGETQKEYLPACAGRDNMFQNCNIPCPPPGVIFSTVIGEVWTGAVCLTDPPTQPLGPTTGMIQRAFRTLEWPAASMKSYPRSGFVVINRENVLFTELDGSKTQTVTLLGVDITIEATPTTYVWHSDEGGDSWETTHPGRPYTGGDATDEGYVWVKYQVPDVRVSPSVDVVYSGRWRIGNDPWTDIPETLTVPGDAISLVTRAARANTIDTH